MVLSGFDWLRVVSGGFGVFSNGLEWFLIVTVA